MRRPNMLCSTLAIWLTAAGAVAQPEEPEQHAEKAPEAPPESDQTSWAASLGGTHSAGNTDSWQVVTSSDFKLARGPHAFGANAALAYGRAKVPGSDELQDTVKNFNAKLRYDYFFTDYDALFFAGRFRWDEFAGLDARVQGQPGYLRIFFKQEKQRLWGELGYDLTYDNFHPLPNPDYMVELDMDGDGVDDDGDLRLTPDGDEVIHSARLFVGYENQVNEVLTYVGGVEGLVNVEQTDDIRVAFDNALRSKIAGNLQLEVKFILQYDNVPVPGAEKYDTQTQVNLIYNLI